VTARSNGSGCTNAGRTSRCYGGSSGAAKALDGRVLVLVDMKPRTAKQEFATDGSATCIRNGARTLPTGATRLAKPTARPCLGVHPAPMLGDPRLGVSFGFERADPGRIAVRDAYLDTE
jgi:hypothetical protein